MHGRVCVALMAAALAAAMAVPASATVLIQRDPGGRVGTYIDAFAAVRSSGQRVVIDGTCLSACTMVLGLVPRERVCVTRRGHRRRATRRRGSRAARAVRNAAATQILWDIYPEEVRAWLARNGGLSSKMIYLRGRELAAMVPLCNAEARVARKPAIDRAQARRKTPAMFANTAGN